MKNYLICRAALLLCFAVRGFPVAPSLMAAEGLVLPGEEFRSRWPEGTDVSVEDANKDNGKNAAIFVWSDLNSDGQVQPDEAAFRKGACGGVTVMSDLSFCASRVNGSAPRAFSAASSSRKVPAPASCGR